jgi:hypothetical protein
MYREYPKRMRLRGPHCFVLQPTSPECRLKPVEVDFSPVIVGSACHREVSITPKFINDRLHFSQCFTIPAFPTVRVRQEVCLTRIAMPEGSEIVNNLLFSCNPSQFQRNATSAGEISMTTSSTSFQTITRVE